MNATGTFAPRSRSQRRRDSASCSLYATTADPDPSALTYVARDATRPELREALRQPVATYTNGVPDPHGPRARQEHQRDPRQVSTVERTTSARFTSRSDARTVAKSPP